MDISQYVSAKNISKVVTSVLSILDKFDVTENDFPKSTFCKLVRQEENIVSSRQVGEELLNATYATWLLILANIQYQERQCRQVPCAICRQLGLIGQTISVHTSMQIIVHINNICRVDPMIAIYQVLILVSQIYG